MFNRSKIQKGVFSLLLLPVMLGGVVFWVNMAQGIQLQVRSVKLSNSVVSATTRYEVSFVHQSASSVGSVRLQVCANDPLIGQPCTPPTGFSATGAVLEVQTGINGFTISPASTGNEIILTRTPGIPPANTAALYEFSNIVNPSSAGTYFIRVESFASTDATGPNLDYGGLAFNINRSLSINVTVPPFLLFCTGVTIQPYDCGTATGAYTDFGDFSPTSTKTGKLQMLVATNAEFGYTVRAFGPTLTSGVNSITPLATPDVSRQGVNQFGMNLRANVNPSVGQEVQGSGVATIGAGYNTPNSYKFVSGDVIASSTTSDAYRLYTISYIVNIANGQAPGIYVTTLQYIALATF